MMRKNLNDMVDEIFADQNKPQRFNPQTVTNMLKAKEMQEENNQQHQSEPNGKTKKIPVPMYRSKFNNECLDLVN